MRTITTNVYQFDELSEMAKQSAIEKYRNTDYDYSFYYDELKDSIKAMCEVFNIKTGNRSWSDLNFGNIDDNILQLAGVRLYKYIMNNYYSDLFKPKYLKHGELSAIKKPSLPMKKQSLITSDCSNKRLYSISYYSNINKDNSCVLTGVCYDMDILDPVYNFLRNTDKGTNFKDLFNSIEHAISKAFECIDEWVNSDEFIIEEIQANNYEFTENGQLI